jgi:hypothetical protein
VSVRTSQRNRRSRLVPCGLRLETLEARRCLASDCQNPLNPLDVDDSGLVTPLEVLRIVNNLNGKGSRVLPPPTAACAPPPYLDVDGNGGVSSLDALLVVNALNDNPNPLAISVGLAPESDPDGNGVVLQPQVPSSDR